MAKMTWCVEETPNRNWRARTEESPSHATPPQFPCESRGRKRERRSHIRICILPLNSTARSRHRQDSGGRESMVHGTLEVLLVGAKGLENTDYLCNMDPYALLKCRSQEQRSSIASGKGSNPEWNESFVFTVSDHATELVIKLMDSDSGTSDDFVGEATYAYLPIHI
ncbi:hypothetical protein VPH35_111399 [Triticum aestivum]